MAGHYKLTSSKNPGVLNLAKVYGIPLVNTGQNNSRFLILDLISWFPNRMILNLDQNYTLRLFLQQPFSVLWIRIPYVFGPPGSGSFIWEYILLLLYYTLPLVKGTDPYPDPDHSIIKQKK